MENQNKINRRQATINNSQGTINDGQGTINDDQNTINEQTKIDLSVRNFWAILILVVGAALTMSTAYLVNNFRIASDINKIDAKLTYIADGLEKHLNAAEEARKDMRIVSAQRDTKFNEIDQKFMVLKTILKIDY